MKCILYFFIPIVYSFCQSNYKGLDNRPSLKEDNNSFSLIQQYQQKTLLDNLTNNNLSIFHKLDLIEKYNKNYSYSLWKGLHLYDF